MDPTPRSPSRSASGPLPTTVLVVEDDLPVMEMACTVLQAAGLAVRSARSAEEAVQRWREGPFDALFCDVMLPGASGIDLARQLLAEHPDLPILVTSGQRSADVRDAVDASGLAFLAKPYTAKGLRDALGTVLAAGGEAP